MAKTFSNRMYLQESTLRTSKQAKADDNRARHEMDEKIKQAGGGW